MAKTDKTLEEEGKEAMAAAAKKEADEKAALVVAAPKSDNGLKKGDRVAKLVPGAGPADVDLSPDGGVFTVTKDNPAGLSK